MNDHGDTKCVGLAAENSANFVIFQLDIHRWTSVSSVPRAASPRGARSLEVLGTGKRTKSLRSFLVGVLAERTKTTWRPE